MTDDELDKHEKRLYSLEEQGSTSALSGENDAEFETLRCRAAVYMLANINCGRRYGSVTP